MEALRDALGSEVKSSAGDKHETGRAMIQLEMERAASRLSLQEDQLQRFERLVAVKDNPVARIAPGSLVVTEKEMYFITVSLGPVEVSGQRVQVLSPISPVGKLLNGNRVGDAPEFRGVAMAITAIA